MSIDPKTLEEARALVADAGMTGFHSVDTAYTSTRGTLVPIDLVDAMARAPGVPNFNKEDPERPGVVRAVSILQAIRDGIAMPPLVPVLWGGERCARASSGTIED